MIIQRLILLGSTLFIFNACCKPQIVTEYIPCKYPTIVDLNYTNDTNYTLDNIEFEVVEEDSNETTLF